ncbi:hypothetical protein KO528_01425 [Saccharophagus degradans]|uniref:hypothetical protein n=1 Tax=Saccharophagus degradans TaxID=86304 RepID=UPI001C09B091|nr:hypothetical protein [Saccharophagus degradans]MBU2983998.1 hypothetical protein [Saccharophagus degradans]
MNIAANFLLSTITFLVAVSGMIYSLVLWSRSGFLGVTRIGADVGWAMYVVVSMALVFSLFKLKFCSSNNLRDHDVRVVVLAAFSMFFWSTLHLTGRVVFYGYV